MPLGVILKNEQKLEDMVEIMDHLQEYVPMTTTTEETEIAGSTVPVVKDSFHCTLIGKYS